MPLPPSFRTDGFGPYVHTGANKFRRLMIGCEGETDTGKTEFSMSAPGPGIILALDRNFDGTLLNPNPPKARNLGSFAFDVTQAPLFTQAAQSVYLEYWKAFYARYRKALENKDCRTIVIDGDSDSWELQRLAEFGTLTKVKGPPGLAYTEVNAARRAMIARAWDSGKIIIATNKVKAEYETVYNADGTPKTDTSGREERRKTGRMERQGFGDTDYLWQIQLRHMHKLPSVNSVTKKEVPEQWGIKILKCKMNTALVGSELWGDDCNFASLVQYVMPNIPLSDWGY